MISLRKWIKNVFEGMAFAFIHPFKNSPPPEIGTHSYTEKPYRGNNRLWYT
tara:strand:+ start:1298 stop:1450 length:153 start_codon:yes stop_codon:yes gene_type:complete